MLPSLRGAQGEAEREHYRSTHLRAMQATDQAKRKNQVELCQGHELSPGYAGILACVPRSLILNTRVERRNADAFTVKLKPLHLNRIRRAARSAHRTTNARGFIFQHERAECL